MLAVTGLCRHVSRDRTDHMKPRIVDPEPQDQDRIVQECRARTEDQGQDLCRHVG